jgi:hypothetical protein
MLYTNSVVVLNTIGAEFDEHNNRGIDPYSPVWNLFDLLPHGLGDWYHDHNYMEGNTS